MKFTITTENSHKHTVCLSSQRTQEGSVVSFHHSSASFNSMTNFVNEHWALRISVSFPIQPSTPWQVDPPLLPIFSIELISPGNLLDFRGMCNCPPLSHFWISPSSWLSLTTTSTDFPLPFAFHLFTNFCFLSFCSLNSDLLSGSFLGCYLSSINTLSIFSLCCLTF